MAVTIVSIDQPIRVDVDEEDDPHVFSDITTANITNVAFAETEDAPLEVTFDEDLSTEQMNAIVRLARATPDSAPPADVAPPAPDTITMTQLGIGSLRITVSPVSNPSDVEYRYYFGTNEANVGDMVSSSLVATSSASFLTVSEDPSTGDPIDPDVEYYAKVLPVSGSEIGAPTATVGPASPRRATGNDIEADAISARELSVNSVDAENMVSQMIIGTEIATAPEGGKRVGMDPDGIFADDSEGVRRLTVDGDNLYYDGAARLRNAEFVGSAIWSGDNVGNTGGSTMMASSVSAPGVQPTVEAAYDTIELDDGDTVGDDETQRQGIVWDGSHWWVATRFDAGLGPSFLGVALAEFDADGTFVDLHDSGERLSTNSRMSLTRIGTSFYQGFEGRIYRYNASGAFQELIEIDLAPGEDATWGTDGTNLIGAWSTGPVTLAWQKYNPSTGAQVGSTVNTVGRGAVYAIGQGTFDYGAQRVVAVVGGQFNAYQTDGTWTDAFSSPSAWRGFCWNGSQFVALSSAQGDFRTLYLHTANLKDESLTTTVDLAPASTWYGSDGPYETAASERQLVAFPKRAKYRLRTAGVVPGAGGTDEPDGARFYVGRTTGRAKLERQDTIMATFGTRAEVTLDTLDLPSGTNNADNPPPSSGNFPDAVPYEQYSQAINGNGDRLTYMDGSGAFHAFLAFQAGTVSLPITAANTTETVSVTFDTTFDSAPAVLVTPNFDQTPHQLFVIAGNITASGFDVIYRRSLGTANFAASWAAFAKTQ